MRATWLCVAFLPFLWGAGISAVRAVPSSTIIVIGTVAGQSAGALGVIIARNGATITVLTAGHMRDVADLTCVTMTGERLPVIAQTPVPAHDLLLLRVREPATPFTIAELGPQPARGTALRVWGPDAHGTLSVYEALVRSGDERVTDAPDDAIALTCDACAPGFSGSGLYDASGRLVGIVVAGYRDTQTGAIVLTLAESYVAALTTLRAMAR